MAIHSSVNFALMALAAAGVLGQDICTAPTATGGATYTIHNLAEATAITNCSKFTGSISVAPEYSGHLDLGSITTIDGDFRVSNVENLTEIDAQHLQAVSGQLFVSNCSNLGSITQAINSLGTATDVGGLRILDNPNLLYFAIAISDYSHDITIRGAMIVNLGFLTSVNTLSLSDVINITLPVLENAENVVIESSTFTEFNAPELALVQTNIQFSNNQRTTSISFPQLQSIGGIFDIFSNDNLESVNIPKLGAVGLGLRFQINERLTEVIIPTLQTIGALCCGLSHFTNLDITTPSFHALIVSYNPNLTNISIPLLESIGTDLEPGKPEWHIYISEIPQITRLESFISLKTINGSVYVAGNFSDISFPALAKVTGDFDIISSNPISADCSTFQTMKDRHSIVGSFECVSPSSQGGPTTINPSSTPSNSTSTHSSLGPGAKAGIGVGGGTAGILLILVSVVAFMKFRKRQKVPPKDVTEDIEMPRIPATLTVQGPAVEQGRPDSRPPDYEPTYELPPQ